jgi:hypothetical protein
MRPEPTSVPDRDPLRPAYHEPYTFGRPPSTYLATREIVRLTILRSKLRDRTAHALSTAFRAHHIDDV